ncbi:MAG: bifunctional riboflavin kinase/FAD synthetase [Oscillospiraceae bacterium]|nr:bifunctional riboflavin kinase/FAD synthetase [Oscillospiraceae bacterium]
METEKKRVIALGFFDGVHRGHAALLRETTRVAKKLGVSPAVVTFDVHPENLIMGQPVHLLNSTAERADLMRRLFGIDEVIFAHFDYRMMKMPWETFLTDFLIRQCGAVYLVAGHDYHFGYKGEGNPVRLQEKCAQLDIGCSIIQKVELDGATVSSSYIRTLVAQGEMERAVTFLGHPHSLIGQVVHGRQLGQSIGFPTINLKTSGEVLLPRHGVYVTRVFFPDGTSYPTVTNVGVRPTVEEGGSIRIEGFLLGFSGNVYEETVRMEFYKFLRPERKFASLDDLAAQIANDVNSTKRYFESAAGM